MNYQDINVPVAYHYLSDWHELLDILPQSGKFILNKVNPGCGGTTLFLESDRPCILVSPRSDVLYCKADQHPSTYLFRKKDNRLSVLELKEELRDYINACRCYSPWGKTIIPKILVTIDSYPYVAEQLSSMGVLGEFTVVADEFQRLMSDSKFKGKKDLEFLHNLRDVKSVCYMSATPIPETYLENFPDFDDVSTYYKLIWDPSAVEPSNLHLIPYGKKESIQSICRKIIANYRQNGHFARKRVGDLVVESKQVVIFVNDVKSIKQIIKENNLNPCEVNVICSPGNKYVNDLKSLGVSIGGQSTDKTNPDKFIFTFVSSAAFDGVDFYSWSAFTYIFCDGILDWNKNDMLIDVPQILGRQRLDQPFRKDAILYYRADSRKDSQKRVDSIKMKEEETKRWIDDFNSATPNMQKRLRDGIIIRDPKLRYANDYVEVVNDINGGYQIRENYLVKSMELRDYEMSMYVYNNPLQIFKAVNSNPNIKMSSTCRYNTLIGDSMLDAFYLDFLSAHNFHDKMRLYADLRDQHPEYTELLYQDFRIDCNLHTYYNTLGGDRLRTLGYREKDIAKEVADQTLNNLIIEKCKGCFVVGYDYLLSDVKTILQGIYDEVGKSARAKANDLPLYMPNARPRQLTTPTNGKRELYYTIC